MNWNEEPMTVRRFVWLAGWVVVALMVLILLVFLFQAALSSDGQVTGMVLTPLSLR